ncbi:MAG: hypothetical protein M3463_05965 [Verrucomicrobiota bacterium]|nr:hypothetical protein [Verrucomicrobiota bacterium]
MLPDLLWLLLAAAAVEACAGNPLRAAEGQSTAGKPHRTVIRLEENPIIRPDMLSGNDGENICGPSLIRVPDWLEKPLGKYYLYFAHHKGKYIRLAYADRLTGPWTVHTPGTLKLDDVLAAGDYRDIKGGHIASPDVHVDHERREIRMYFHGLIGPGARWGHRSGVATSKDGISFKLAVPKPIGDPYFRVFQWEGYYYALTRTGNLARSSDGLTNWVEREDTFPLGKQAMGLFAQAAHNPEAKAFMRHTALKLDGKVLSVFFTRTGDAPESILLSQADMRGDWTTWKLSRPVTLLKPETDYEGGKLPVQKSRAGSTLKRAPSPALQDPCIYREGDRTYLLYSVIGERGIAIAELKD